MIGSNASDFWRFTRLLASPKETSKHYWLKRPIYTLLICMFSWPIRSGNFLHSFMFFFDVPVLLWTFWILRVKETLIHFDFAWNNRYSGEWMNTYDVGLYSTCSFFFCSLYAKLCKCTNARTTLNGVNIARAMPKYAQTNNAGTELVWSRCARVTRIMRAYSLTSIGRDLRATTDLSKFNRLAFRGTTKKQLDCVPNLKQRKNNAQCGISYYAI